VIDHALTPPQQVAADMLSDISELMEKGDLDNVRVDLSHHVPYLGGYSAVGDTIYIDSRCPRMVAPLSECDRAIDVVHYLTLHELVEKQLLDAGFSYNEAHNIAEAAEEAALLLDGHDPQRYYGSLYLAYNHTLREFDPLLVPLDLDLRPYESDELDSVVGRIRAVRDHVRAVVAKAMGQHPSMPSSTFSPVNLVKSKDNVGKVVGKTKDGYSYRIQHNYKIYSSGPFRGQYVHRVKAEKKLGRKLRTDEHVDHVDGNRRGGKIKVLSASAHSAKTNRTRAKSKNGYTGDHRVEHTGSH
jgi:hypothetical protein